MDARPPLSSHRERNWAQLAIVVVTGLLAIPFLRHRGGTTAAPAITPLLGQPAPQISGTTANGHQLDLTAQRGHWVLVNFLATWCTGCRDEQPQLDALAAEHPRGDLTIISVVYQDSLGGARRFLAARHATWPLIDDAGGKIADSYLVQGLPESFVIGPDGTIAAALIGSIHSREVDAVLASPRGP
jgi:cytochrome c biogenesis protein CcmG/thiol:disulfide interchange protein DsbE